MKRGLFIFILLMSSLIAFEGPRIFAAPQSARLVSFRELSDQDLSPHGKAALSVNSGAWKHAETEHFIYHFTDTGRAETVYIHAEVYYEWIKKLFGVSRDSWKKKAHVFIFDDEAVWKQFRLRIHDLLQGDAFTNGWELYIYRHPNWAAPRLSLAHELTHLILFRFLDGPIPISLNEGFAEFVSYRALAMQLRRSEFDVRRSIPKVTANEAFRLQAMISATEYPRDRLEIFYRQSEWMIRYLILKYSGEQFYAFLRDVSRGVPFERSLERHYNMDMERFEKEFNAFAIAQK